MPANSPSYAVTAPYSWDKDNWYSFLIDSWGNSVGALNGGIQGLNDYFKSPEYARAVQRYFASPAKYDEIKGFGYFNYATVVATTAWGAKVSGGTQKDYFDNTVKTAITQVVSAQLTKVAIQGILRAGIAAGAISVAAIPMSVVIPVSFIIGTAVSIAYDAITSKYEISPYEMIGGTNKDGDKKFANDMASFAKYIGDFFSNYSYDEHVETTASQFHDIISSALLSLGLDIKNDYPNFSNFVKGVGTAISIPANFIAMPIMYTAQVFFKYKPETPLIIDMDHNGVKVYDINDVTVYFDIKGDGSKSRTSWVDKNDAFLVIDRNGNNRIDDGREMFGSSSGNGFSELSAYDDNSDGFIDYKDSVFPSLKLWFDRNTNSETDYNELISLSGSGIEKISLSYVNDSIFLNGNATAGRSIVFWEGSSANPITSEIVDVLFNTDNKDRFDSRLGTYIEGTTPVLRGWGNVLDSDIENMNAISMLHSAESVTAEISILGYSNKLEFDNFMVNWTKAKYDSGIDRGKYIDNYKVDVLEAFFDNTVIPLDKFGNETGSSQLSGYQARNLDINYNILYDHYKSSFIVDYYNRNEIDVNQNNIVYIYADLYRGLMYDRNSDRIYGHGNTILSLASFYGEIFLKDNIKGLYDLINASIEGYKSLYGSGKMYDNFYNQNDKNYLTLYHLAREIELSKDSSNIIVKSYESGDILKESPETIGISGFNNQEPNDTYLYYAISGDKYIKDGGDGYSGGMSDRLVFVGLSQNQVKPYYDGNEYGFIVDDTNGFSEIKSVVHLVEQGLDEQYGARGIEVFSFIDGTWSAEDFYSRIILVQESDGDDEVVGTNRNDVIKAGKGDDLLKSSLGDDVYIYNYGDGNDIIMSSGLFIPSGNNSLQLNGIKPSDINYLTDGLNLYLEIRNMQDGKSIEGKISILANRSYFDEPEVKSIKFDNGTNIAIADAYALARAAQITDGNDEITGTAGPDVMRGGKGDDHLTGGTGVDTYVYARGDGNDIVDDGLVFENNNLVLHGITVSEMKVAFVGYDVVISFADSATGAGDAGSIRFRADDYWHAHALGTITFDDGTVLNPSQWTGIGYDQANVFHPGDGDRTVRVNFTDGAVHAFLLHSYTPDQVSVTGVDYLGQITLSMVNDAAGTTEAIHLVNPPWEKGVDQIQFDNGAVWTRDDLRYKAYLDDGTHGSTVTMDTAIYANQSAFVGGTGDTIYIVDAGLQPVSIADHGGTNALTLRGVSQAQVDFSVDAQTDELVMAIHDVPGRNDSVIKFAHGLDTKGVAAVNFDDGSMTAAEIQTWIDTHHLAA